MNPLAAQEEATAGAPAKSWDQDHATSVKTTLVMTRVASELLTLSPQDNPESPHGVGLLRSGLIKVLVLAMLQVLPWPVLDLDKIRTFYNRLRDDKFLVIFRYLDCCRWYTFLRCRGRGMGF